MIRSALLAAAALLLPTGAQAHRMWMLPSSSVVSGDDVWVTVDAAVSNDLFYFEHQPLRVQPVVTEPDGATGKVENLSTGRYRTTFDVHVTKKGTYRIAAVMDGVMGSYVLDGTETRLPRGTTAATLAAAIPAGATDVKTSRNTTRNEIYVTSGAPTTTIFTPTGKGIELVPVTHPNDLVAGEKATFKFLLDGKPAAGLPVTIIPGGIRYRDKLNQIDARTAVDGSVSVTWPAAGMYWLNVTSGPTGEGMGGGGMGGAPNAARPAGQAPERAAPRPPMGDRVGYITVLEVLAP